MGGIRSGVNGTPTFFYMACGMTVPTTTPTWSRESRCASPPTPTHSRSERDSDRTGVDDSKTFREIDNGQCCFEVRELSRQLWSNFRREPWLPPQYSECP